MTRRESETEEHRRLSSSTSSRDRELAWLPVLFTGDPKGRVLELPQRSDTDSRTVVVPIRPRVDDRNKQTTHARRWTCVVIVGQGIFGKGSRVAISASELRRSVPIIV